MLVNSTTIDQPSLRSLTEEFGYPTIENGFFHNAGNDANYTLRLLLMIATSGHPAAADNPRTLRLRASGESAMTKPKAHSNLRTDAQKSFPG